jgi:hypothetical protein
MSTAQHFKPNRRDVEFNLFEFLDIGSTTLGKGPYAHLDEDTARVTLRELEKFCVNEMASSYVSADREGLQFDGKGNVTLPAGLRKSLEAWYANGWDRFELPERLGGVGSPPSLVWGGFDFISPDPTRTPPSTCSARSWRGPSTASARTRRRHVSSRPSWSAQWGGSMVLTEPDAGSDVGAGRTRAWPVRTVTARGTSRASSVSSPTATTTRREHRPPRARPPGRRGPRHQGPVAVHRAQVLGRGEDGKRRRAQRHRLHERREEDGHQSLGDLRDDHSAMARPAAACSWARSTTASARCSTSSRTPAWPWA